MIRLLRFSATTTFVGELMQTPVILDTDIGFDVDDVWALALLLRCPELDLRLVLSSTGDTHYGAALAAKLLATDGRQDVPVGVGLSLDEQQQTHSAWLDGYKLADYDGEVSEDGVGCLIDTIMQSPERVTLISIGPLANLAAALAREPRIVNNSRLVGMHGSLRQGYLGAPKPAREYNLKKHTAAAQQVFASDWDITLTPLDTCGTIQLRGQRFADVLANKTPLVKAIRDNHFGWFDAIDWPIVDLVDHKVESSVLFDTVAIYLALAETSGIDLLALEDLPIALTKDAKTLIQPGAKQMHCATSWHDQEAFLDWLVTRLTAVQG